MFHIILTLLDVIGFEGEDIVVAAEYGVGSQTEARVARTQASYFLGAALATYVKEMKLGIPALLEYADYDPAEHINNHFARHCRPLDLPRVPVLEHAEDAYELSQILGNWYGAVDHEVQGSQLPPTVEASAAASAKLTTAAVPGDLREASSTGTVVLDSGSAQTLLGTPFTMASLVSQNRRARRTGGKPEPYSRKTSVSIKPDSPPVILMPDPFKPGEFLRVAGPIRARKLDLVRDRDIASPAHSSMPSLESMSPSSDNSWSP